MKWGIHIPKDRRRVMAARALEIRLASKSENAALAVIEDEFDVSSATARNLVSYGKYLLERGRNEEVNANGKIL